ncbi:glucosaminidase domain-containing protein [Hymenobacter sp. ASUV-10]|uniref:Glucosaminidase domain-containing protein n=1 Tax=Hymenobacter aranciens TaxID=3063996 RepID=A0ABT9B7Q1_9BACT|nr:glucosaminidase domain-containing protein [Hymenobacter sp. ASUV-10]MDO7873683.1 glucosaminidase domain-containing protein [Hymenobacter sp. ASUV-10]
MTWAEKIAWFGKWYPLALATEKKYGVPALVTLAQHVFEGGWNNKNKGFNLFGVKPWAGWKGATQLQRTWEVHSTTTVKYPKVYSVTKRADGKYRYDCEAYFCKYDSPQQAYDEHARFLVVNPRYKPAFAVKHDAEAFARAIAKAGYATDPEYAGKLVSMIREFSRPDFAKKPVPQPAAALGSSSSPASGGTVAGQNPTPQPK